MTDQQIQADPREGASPSLDPANADARFGALANLPGGSRLHRAARTALAEMHTAAAELHEAIDATRGRGTITTRPGRREGELVSTHRGDVRATSTGKLRAFSGQEPRLVDAAAQRFATVARRVDSALAAIDEVERDTSDAVGKALADPRAETISGALRAQEVRAHVRGLEPSQRLNFLSQRVSAGDLPTVSAILNGPSFTSGIEDETLGAVRSQAEQRFGGDAFVVREAARRARAMIQQAGRTFATRWRSSIEPLGPGESEKAARLESLAGGAA